MEKRRILLLCDQQLLGESLGQILRQLIDMELSDRLTFEDDVLECLSHDSPELLLIAEEEPPRPQVTCLIAKILETYPWLPIIHIKLDQNDLRVYTSRALTARSADLIEAIRHLLARNWSSYDVH